MPGSGKAFVTLLTSPSYLPGVLVLLHSLLNLHPAPRDFQIVCLVTPETVDAKTIGELRNAGFDLVVGVEGIGSGKAGQDGLSLMGRPDLNLALTKLHIFRLSPLFHTVIYLDADVLPLRPLSHLFDSTAPHVLSASPDTGWPDCFNSGVLVVRPRESDWEGLRGLLKNGEGDQGIYAEKDGSGNGSFDGADQGLLNEWFSEEGGGGAWNRLSFTYNVTPSAAYQYAPAYKRYGNKINAVHFIGKSKPWSNLLYRPAGISNVKGKEGVFDYPTLIDRWYAIYDAHVRPTAAHNPDVSRRFTVPEHQAIWNTTSTGAPQQPVDRLDLDALKAATALGVLSLKQGQYTSLPLDGRVDLIMPKPQPKPAKSVRFNDGQAGAASSVPTHYQPPQAQAPPADHAPSSSSPDPSASQPPLESAPAPMPVEQQFERPAIWDAQRYSPPAGSLPEMGNSTIEFYQNAWDAPASHQGQYYYQQQSHAQQPEPEYPTLPANVVQDQWYQQFTSSVPDRSAVQAVFPWEGKQRQATRVFPRGSTPPPLHDQHKPNVAPDLSVQSATPPFSSSQQQQQQRTPDAAPPPAPVRSMAEAMASYTNAWDHDDSIKRYMSRITGVPLPSTKKDSKSMYDAGLRSVPPTPSTAQLKRLDSHVSHDTRSSASGDGDDEDEGDDYEDDEDDASRQGRGPSGEPRSPRVSMRRYREKQRTYSNSGGAESSTSPNPRYRDKHAQTDRQHMQDVGLQVNDPVNSPTARTFTAGASSGSGPGSSGMKDQGSGSHMPMPLPTKKRDAAKPTRSSGSDTPTATSPYASTTRSSAPPASAANATQTQPASSVPRRIPFPVQQPSTDRVPQRARQQSRDIGAHSFHPSSGTGIGLGSSGKGSQDTASPTSVVSNLPTGLPPRSSIDSVRSSSSVSPTAGASPPLPLSPLGGGQGSGNGTGNGNGNGNAHGRRRESQDVAPSAVDASGMPSVRASRHFAPETDIGVRKGQTLEVLQRLMRGSGNGSGP